MSAFVKQGEEEWLSEMLSKLDSTFGSRKGLKNLVAEAKTVLSNLKNGFAREMAEEVAQLVLKGESEETIKKHLLCNFPSGVTIRNVEEMLKLVYVGTGTENIKKAIDFVQIFDSCHHAQAYKALYDDVKFKNHTEEPEMLLLQKKIRQDQMMGPMDETKKLVDADCCKIISRIVKGIQQEDYSISLYINKTIDESVLDDNIATIVREFFTGTLESCVLLLQYSQQLCYFSNRCFVIDALLKELEKQQLLNSEQAMHLWAHANFTTEDTNWTRVKASTKKLCTDALEKLSPNKQHHFFKHYQKYIDFPSKQVIRDLHFSNPHLCSIVHDFAIFYYNGNVVKTQNLLEAANAMPHYLASGSILSVMHKKMAQSDQLDTFETFRLFNIVKCKMSLSNYDSIRADQKKPLEQLKENASACVHQLLWPEGASASEFQLVNKFYNATLSVHQDNSVVCFDSRDKRSNQTWKITIDEETSMLTLTHVQKSLQLGTRNNLPCLVQTGVVWRVKVVDQDYLKIFCGINGKC